MIWSRSVYFYMLIRTYNKSVKTPLDASNHYSDKNKHVLPQMHVLFITCSNDNDNDDDDGDEQYDWPYQSDFLSTAKFIVITLVPAWFAINPIVFHLSSWKGEKKRLLL